MNKKTDTKTTEIILIGAGMAGLSLAALLGQAGVRVTVIDREDPEFLASEEFDSRTVALSLGTKNVLAPLGMWDELEEYAEAIRSIDVQEGHDPFVLNFEADAETGAFGWILPNTRVRKVLYDTARHHDVRFIQGILQDIEIAADHVTAVLTDGQKVTARLLIGADGRMSRVRDLLGFDTVNLDYRQIAWVGLIEHALPHHGLALERFYPEGPFAALPFTDDNGMHRSAIVWTHHAPSRSKSLPDLKTITQKIEPLLDERYGTVKAIGKWAAYPLNLCHAKQFIQTRVALISDAAHAMHPIAGQGLNVGMRDVKELSALLIHAKENGFDYGDKELLEKYQRARRFDVMTMMAATDLLNRLFGNKIWPVRKIRSFGLGLVDRLPPLKKFFTNVATGT